jgi:hypothetical protein
VASEVDDALLSASCDVKGPDGHAADLIRRRSRDAMNVPHATDRRSVSDNQLGERPGDVRAALRSDRFAQAPVTWDPAHRLCRDAVEQISALRAAARLM